MRSANGISMLSSVRRVRLTILSAPLQSLSLFSTKASPDYPVIPVPYRVPTKPSSSITEHIHNIRTEPSNGAPIPSDLANEITGKRPNRHPTPGLNVEVKGRTLSRADEATPAVHVIKTQPLTKRLIYYDSTDEFVQGKLAKRKKLNAANEKDNEKAQQAFKRARCLTQIPDGKDQQEGDIYTNDLFLIYDRGTPAEREKSAKLLQLKKEFRKCGKLKFRVPPLDGTTVEKLDRLIELWARQIWIARKMAGNEDGMHRKRSHLGIEQTLYEEGDAPEQVGKQTELEVDEEMRVELDFLLQGFKPGQTFHPMSGLGAAQVEKELDEGAAAWTQSTIDETLLVKDGDWKRLILDKYRSNT